MHPISSTDGIATDEGVPREIVRTLRRICLWEELERDAAAVAAEQRRLDELVAALPAASPLPAARLAVLRRAEQDRAASAAALSELLAPLLAESLEVAAAALAAGRPRPSAPGPAPRRRERPAAPLPIADLIDGMLAQEAEFHPRPSAPRPSRQSSATTKPTPP